jgi:hypothetical protein
MRNGWEYSDGLVYSPGRRRKKKATHSMSIVAREVVSPARCASKVASRRIGRGIGLKREGGASAFAYSFICLERRKSMVFVSVAHLGSRLPKRVYICETKQRASATVPDRTL